jgi:hypothetical protein
MKLWVQIICAIIGLPCLFLIIMAYSNWKWVDDMVLQAILNDPKENWWD